MTDSLLDLLDFIEEQIELAKSESDRFAAVDAARGAIPLIRSRFGESGYIQTIFMLVSAQPIEDPHWREWWAAFAKAGNEEFSEKANELLEAVKQRKLVLERLKGQLPS